jgi:hypothetical protein
MGCINGARKILKFYWNIYKKFGLIKNAQGIGVDNLFHYAENDEVEITGYLMIQAFDYLKVSNDVEFIIEISSMLIWAFNCQKKHLRQGMLPFNGDETYIAGGLLPRSVLEDASSESTMLFIFGGNRLIHFLQENNIMNEKVLTEMKQVIETANALYSENFVYNNKYITNNPKYKIGAEAKKYRYGVCLGYCGWFGWTELSSTGAYLCPYCNHKGINIKVEDEIFAIKSANLMPYYIGSDLIDKNILNENINNIVEDYITTGQVASRPGLDVCVGYDYGLILYNLVEIKDYEHVDLFFNLALNAIDECGAWSEFYQNGEPRGTRFRPWESAINIEGILHYSNIFKNAD